MKKFAVLAMVLMFTLALCACATPEGVDETTLPTTSADETVSEETILEETTPEEEKVLWDIYLFKELIAPNGVTFELADYGSIIRYDETRCLLKLGCNSIWLADCVAQECICLSGEQIVINYTVAYDTIYWFNLDSDVWASNWLSLDPSAKLFCEDAIAVSPFTDESRGAVVDPERANWNAYDLPIYSPYGE